MVAKKREVLAEQKFIKEQKKNACKISIIEGSASSAASGFGDSFIIPLAQAIKANSFHIGLISAFSGLLAPIAQHFGNKLMEKQSRKQIVQRFVLFQSLIWLPIAAIALLYWKGTIGISAPWLLILCYSILAIIGGLASPAWFSWMGDIVDEKHRGKYFSKRNIFTGAVGIIVSILGSLIIKKSEVLGWTFIGFGLMFFLAFVFRFAGYLYFRKMYEPEFNFDKKDEFTMIDFLKRYDNYGKFAVYQALFNFAIMIASPFFGFYLLSELGYSNNLVMFMIITMSSSVFSLIFNPLAGKISDKYGNLKLLYIGTAFFILSPIVWLFSTNLYWLILVPGIVAGIANSANNIAITNFTYDSISHPDKRGTCIAYTNILVGIGVFVGSILGGLILNYLKNNPIGFNAFFLVFILAAIARLAVSLIFLPQLKEVRKVKHLLIHPLHPFKAIHHEFHGLGLFVHHHHKR